MNIEPKEKDLEQDKMVRDIDPDATGIQMQV
jgi:hypothetical protein